MKLERVIEIVIKLTSLFMGLLYASLLVGQIFTNVYEGLVVRNGFPYAGPSLYFYPLTTLVSSILCFVFAEKIAHFVAGKHEELVNISTGITLKELSVLVISLMGVLIIVETIPSLVQIIFETAKQMGSSQMRPGTDPYYLLPQVACKLFIGIMLLDKRKSISNKIVG